MAARILYYDIENAPNLSYTWGAGWEENVIEVVRPWFMISFAYRWEGEKATRVEVLSSQEAIAGDDKRLVQALVDLFDEADITVAHNGDKFDKRKVNARMLIHGIEPPSPYKTIDTLKIARQHFMLNSNKLDEVGKVLGVGRKVPHTGFKLWRECMAGDEKALRLMAKYNKGDVTLLRDVYLKLRPFHATHPNLNMYEDGLHACPKCGADEEYLVKRGFRYTNTMKYQTWKCSICTGYSSSRTSERVSPGDKAKRVAVN